MVRSVEQIYSFSYYQTLSRHSADAHLFQRLTAGSASELAPKVKVAWASV